MNGTAVHDVDMNKIIPESILVIVHGISASAEVTLVVLYSGHANCLCSSSFPDLLVHALASFLHLLMFRVFH